MELGFDTGFALPEVDTRKALDPSRTYDVLILGAGPAGLSAAIYLIRKGLDTGIATGDVGGQVTWTATIRNYLGFRIVEGPQLVQKFNEQVLDFPVGISLNLQVTGVSRKEDLFEVRAGERAFTSRALILATGKRPKTLGVPGESRLIGRGVAYCAICDAPLYRGKTTAVVGGGNSGLEAAIDLARGSPKVDLIERGERLTGDAVLSRKIAELSNVEVLLGTEVLEVFGETEVHGVRVKGGGHDTPGEIAVEGLFVEIGLVPNSEPFRGFVTLNPRGEIEVDCRCHTSVPGVFAAGDVTSVPYKQVIIAAGDGAKAALSAYEYILRLGSPGPGGTKERNYGVIQR